LFAALGIAGDVMSPLLGTSSVLEPWLSVLLPGVFCVWIIVLERWRFRAVIPAELLDLGPMEIPEWVREPSARRTIRFTTRSLHFVRSTWLRQTYAIFTLHDPPVTFARMAAWNPRRRLLIARLARVRAGACPLALDGFEEPASRVADVLRAELHQKVAADLP